MTWLSEKCKPALGLFFIFLLTGCHLLFLKKFKGIWKCCPLPSGFLMQHTQCKTFTFVVLKYFTTSFAKILPLENFVVAVWLHVLQDKQIKQLFDQAFFSETFDVYHHLHRIAYTPFYFIYWSKDQDNKVTVKNQKLFIFINCNTKYTRYRSYIRYSLSFLFF